jgi:hypothetical protein
MYAQVLLHIMSLEATSYPAPLGRNEAMKIMLSKSEVKKQEEGETWKLKLRQLFSMLS